MTKTLLLACMLFAAMPFRAQEYKTHHGDGIDDVLQYLPLAAVYGLKAGGVESRHNLGKLSLNVATSYAFTVSIAYALKHTVHDRRPDGTDTHAFPSGHSAIAFAGAHILQKEYGRTSIWIPVAGYTVATATALDRIRRNRHEWDDVLAGCAIGIASTELGYWLGNKILPDRSPLSFAVTPNGMTLRYNL